MIAFTGQDEQSRACKSANGLWRFAYPESPTLSMKNEDVKKRAGQRIATWLKEGVEFKVLRAEPYVLQQRVARQARKGKVLLAGDALHVSQTWRTLSFLILAVEQSNGWAGVDFRNL